MHAYVEGGGMGVSICAAGCVTRREMHGGKLQYCMYDGERERDGFQIQISLTRLFIGVSAFCVLLYELTQSKQIYCHNTRRCSV